jgi:hypothetical protein
MYVVGERLSSQSAKFFAAVRFDAFPDLADVSRGCCMGFIPGKDFCAKRSNERFTSPQFFPHFLPNARYRQDRILHRRDVKFPGRTTSVAL